MAVKNARNFVRDVNTRKICYSFCHPKMAFLSSASESNDYDGSKRNTRIKPGDFLAKIGMMIKSILFHQIHAFFSMILARYPHHGMAVARRDLGANFSRFLSRLDTPRT